MSALPYMPLYVADYLADAAHLTTEEHGAYLLLIMTYWQRGKALPHDSERLARIARMSNERWTDVERTLSEFFTVIDGHWHHKRIDAELEKVRGKSEKAKRAGIASASARKATDAQRTLNGLSTDAQQTFNHTETDTDTDSGGVSAREPLADLEHKLREAAGWQSEPAPMLSVTGEIQALIENGADLETDVLPVVKALAPKCGNRTSWRYFLSAIARQRDQRIAASTIVSPPSSITGFTHAANRQKPNRSDIFATFHARIDAAEHRNLAEGDGDDGIALEGAA